MRCEVPGVEEERLVPTGEATDRVVGPLGDDVGDVAVLEDRGALVVVGEREVEVVVDAGHQGVPVGPAGRARVRGGVAVEELADEAGLVARPAEPRADLVGGVEGLEATEGAGVVLDAVVLGVLTGDELGPRGAAEGVRGDGVGEVQPAVGDAGAGSPASTAGRRRACRRSSRTRRSDGCRGCHHARPDRRQRRPGGGRCPTRRVRRWTRARRTGPGPPRPSRPPASPPGQPSRSASTPAWCPLVAPIRVPQSRGPDGPRPKRRGDVGRCRLGLIAKHCQYPDGRASTDPHGRLSKSPHDRFPDLARASAPCSRRRVVTPWLLLLVALALIAICGLFVAAEFSFVTVDRATVERAASGGDAAAAGVQNALQDVVDPALGRPGGHHGDQPGRRLPGRAGDRHRWSRDPLDGRRRARGMGLAHLGRPSA